MPSRLRPVCGAQATVATTNIIRRKLEVLTTRPSKLVAIFRTTYGLHVPTSWRVMV